MQEKKKDVFGATEEGGMGLPGVNPFSTLRERLRATRQRAAELEREGYFTDAAQYWLAGQSMSVTDTERTWCEARASLCQKRAGFPTGRTTGRTRRRTG